MQGQSHRHFYRTHRPSQLSAQSQSACQSPLKPPRRPRCQVPPCPPSIAKSRRWLALIFVSWLAILLSPGRRWFNVESAIFQRRGYRRRDREIRGSTTMAPSLLKSSMVIRWEALGGVASTATKSLTLSPQAAPPATSISNITSLIQQRRSVR